MVDQAQQVIPPELIEAILGGQQASGQLEPMLGQIAQADQLRQFQAPAGRSMGGQYQAASPLEFLGAALSSHAAQKDYDRLQSQADVLRGKVREGEAAQTRADFLSDEETFRQQQKRLDQAESRIGQAGERIEQAEERLTAGKTYTFPDGSINTVYQRGDGTITDSQGNPVNMAGAKPFSKEDTRVYNVFANSGLPKKDITALLNARRGVQSLNRINTKAEALTDKDKQMLSRGGLDQVIRGMSPQAFEQYINENFKGVSDAGRDFLQAINRYASKERHELFGSALTRNEQALSDAWSAAAGGISFEERMMRLNEAGAGHTDEITNIASLGGIEDPYVGIERFTPWDRETSAPSKQAGGRVLNKTLPAEPTPQAAPAPADNLDAMSDAELEALWKQTTGAQ